MKGIIRFNNVDNIARTKAYEAFGRRHPEIRWARLAGIVSRNAGWNMTDLACGPLASIIPKETRQAIVSVYERANWLIFADAFPQLQLYAKWKRTKNPRFQELEQFFVSRFMIAEWRRFWEERDEIRLMTALIINEQLMLQRRFLDEPALESFFHSVFYTLNELAHFSHVILPTPTSSGYAERVTNFADPTARIALGKRIAAVLYDAETESTIFQFTNKQEPTGSRKEYDRLEKALPLRLVYPRFRHKAAPRTEWADSHDLEEVESFFKPIRVQPVLAEKQRKWAKWELALLAQVARWRAK
ncbi:MULTISPECIES: DUF2515 family protein [Shouchella]|uniref:DUF2515 family protein n=1 Tax=Shouchella TaxID=2893057 RepID=UPI00091D3848|nr:MULTISPECIES: DUF2515 family protein [Shouchella]MBX0319674.1 DUF2515 domain-containing protein [Shouchella clausii]SHL08542.1 Protein of unknown function [Shouchella rhizosphaerae]